MARAALGRLMDENGDVGGSDLRGRPTMTADVEEGMVQPGHPAQFSKGGRRLFPLPHFACPSDKTGSRSVKRRRERIQNLYRDCNVAIDSLNWLADEGAAVGGGLPSDMQLQAMRRVEGLVFSQVPSGPLPTPEGSLRAILHGGSPYDFKTDNETLASYQPELVSIPDSIHGCPKLVDILDGNDRLYLEENSELMLRPAHEVCEDSLIQPYWDTKLRYNRKCYNQLVGRLADIGFFTYTLHPACMVGVFFVYKSNRTKLRLIADARRSNAYFKEAPGVSLMTGEGMGRTEVQLEDNLWWNDDLAKGFSSFIGLSDVKDCFHRMRVPQWLSRYFAWEAVPAKVLNLQGTMLEGVRLEPLTPVYPCAGSLCQGFAWSLYFAQKANETLCRGVNLLREASLANDRAGPVILKVGRDVEQQCHFYVYVDNLGVIDTDGGRVTKAMEELQRSFNSLGLILHKSEVTSGYVEALGCVLEGDRMRTRVNPNRLWKMFQAIAGLMRRGRCVGRVLEILIGHLTFCGLVRRPSLCVFHTVYKFIHRHYGEVAPLWESVREELQAFQGLLFMLVQDWWRPWNRLVSSSDASLTGYGICHSWWEQRIVAKCGRLLERTRFKRMGGHSAREEALTAAGFRREGQRWEPVSSVAAKSLEEAGWEVDKSFEEVPARLLKREVWAPKLWGTWRFNDGILILEALAVLKSVKKIALTRFGHDIRQLHLSDNMSVVLSIERSRSKIFKLLRVIRRISAYLFSRNIHLAIRWIPSELNVADEPSRIEDSEQSKLLVDLIVDSELPVDKSRGKSDLKHAPKTHPHTFVEQPDKQCSSSFNTAGSATAEACENIGGRELSRDPGIAFEERPSARSRHTISDGSSPERLQNQSPSTPGLGAGVEEDARADEDCGRLRRGSWERKYFIRMGGRQKGGKSRTLRNKPRRQLQTLVDRGMEGSRHHLSVLEEAAVSKRARENYQKYLLDLFSFLPQRVIETAADDKIDSQLVEYFNLRYNGGEGSHVGDYILAALMDRFPSFSKYGHRKIPRSWRALSGWRKLCPARSRLAYPLQVWCGIS